MSRNYTGNGQWLEESFRPCPHRQTPDRQTLLPLYIGYIYIYIYIYIAVWSCMLLKDIMQVLPLSMPQIFVDQFLFIWGHA